MPYGELWHYVPSSFLNGLVNHSEPLAWFVVDRYTSKDGMLTIKDRYLDGKPVYIDITKQELIKKIKSGDKTTSELGIFNDDIVIIAKVPSEENNSY